MSNQRLHCYRSAIHSGGLSQTGRIRAFMITGLGFGAVMLLAAFLGITMFQNFWQAFGNAPAK